MQNAECKIILILYRHSEGVKRLWESPLLLLKLRVGDCHEPTALAMTLLFIFRKIKNFCRQYRNSRK